MIDVTECRDITSLQSVVFMALFLYTSANWSTSHSYIGIALRSSLRIGLHRELRRSVDPIERETRRRVFWTIYKIDIYISALLGFPVMLSSYNINQTLLIHTDDEYITKDAVLSISRGETSFYIVLNAHTRLILILDNIC